MERERDLSSASAAPLVRESRFREAGHFAPAVLGLAAATSLTAGVVTGSAAPRILGGLLGAAALLVVVLRELALTRADPERRVGIALGLVLTALFAAQPFAPSVSAFLARAFGARALGLPVTLVASAAVLLLFGPALVLGFPALLALTRGSAGRGLLGGRVALLRWLLGWVEVPRALRADRDRLRVAIAWIASVVAGWIAYTAWRGI